MGCRQVGSSATFMPVGASAPATAVASLDLAPIAADSREAPSGRGAADR